MLSTDSSRAGSGGGNGNWAGAGNSGAEGSGPDAAGTAGLKDVAASLASLLVAGLQEQSPGKNPSGPPASTGEVNSSVSPTAAAS